MEVLNSTISIKSHNPPAVQFLTWKSRINPSRLTIPKSRILPPHPPLSLYLFRSTPSRNLQISARFGRPTNRQNHLRKKLTQQLQQQVSHVQTPVHKFDKVDDHDSNVDTSGESSENLEKRSSNDNESNFVNSSDDRRNLEMSSLDNNLSDSFGVKGSETELRKNKIGESILWNKLESWAEQYKKDSEFWGIGSGPIFNVFQDSEGKVERVVVNEDEILRRSRVDPQLNNEADDLTEVNFKISFAKDLAREMESGSNVIPKNSSVAKFLLSGGESRISEAIRGVTLKPGLFRNISRVGALVLCGLFVVRAIRGLFTVKDDSKEYTRLEKEMLRRKIKARTENEKIVKGSVEVVQDSVEPKSMTFKRPQLDKEQLVNSIIKVKGSKSELEMVEYTGEQSEEFKERIEEIRAMARHAREIERGDVLPDDGDVDDEASKEFSTHNASPQNDFPIGEEVHDRDSDDIGQPANEASSEIQSIDIRNGTDKYISELTNTKMYTKSSDLNEAELHSDDPGESGTHENSSRKKLRIIKSAKEAREYLSRKNHKVEESQKPEVNEQTDIAIPMLSTNAASGNTSQILGLTNKGNDTSPLSGIHEFSDPHEDYRMGSETTVGKVESPCISKEAGILLSGIPGIKADSKTSQNSNEKNEISSSHCENNETLVGLQVPGTTTTNDVKDKTAELAPSANKENWIEKNFHEFEPIVKKIGVGFRNSYQVARDKASQELDSKTELMLPKSDDAESELEWMKDERLRDIVSKVRDNELSGRDPFHLMDEEDKRAFFSGLEKKVDQENEKLLNLHEYFHSNIENLDYGADGISLYDPPEKIIPRWKDPPAEKSPEFLNNFMEQRKALVAEGLKKSFISQRTGKDGVRESKKPSSNDNTPVVADLTSTSKELEKDNVRSSKTIIQGSDGSVRAGKKSGKEYWQHTKKWSEGFLESYNAETDPEVKAVMKDMGKDLDRWITEKEVQEAADLMDKVPEKGRRFIKQKLDKVKREMELFGPQAVVSKYREYADEKEEDYLWWLDLPLVLCIELYTVENGEQRVGFYSLEMAADLELDPKQYHVIAFEDAADCKNLCYIIQAHMEMLGNGNAFVVPRPPKDAFRESKANGFGVTVIRKGQLQLNIDQKLEEVEESIAEIGSKIYHDKITKERGVDINALMKGVFGVSKPTKSSKKKSRRKSKRRHIKP